MLGPSAAQEIHTLSSCEKPNPHTRGKQECETQFPA